MAALTPPSNARSLLLLGVVAWLVFALVTLPATLAFRWFAPDDILASGISGSVWRGSAVALQAQQIDFQDVDWNFRPTALLSGKFGYTISAGVGSGAVQTIAMFSPTGVITLRDTAGVLPVGALSGLLPVTTIDGRIGLDLAELKLKSNWITDARGTVDLVELQLLQPVSEKLGSFALIFDGAADDGLTGQFREVNGPLEARGTLLLLPDNAWKLEGTVKASGDASAQLRRGLPMLGQRNPDGSYPLLFESG
ncbi:MAG: type II secretion system protein N [Gammaproteobacteria bacterium]|nr:type II secretion system protein N [Gammaproteobacteria bacterium]NNF61842.1 type II secretion system protein N [Gammaproteobacteria bacterium]